MHSGDTIELRPNRSGGVRAFIAGTRVRVQDISALSEVEKKSPEQIVAALPHLTLAQVHAALAYYHDHRAEILQELRDAERVAAKVREQTGPGPLAQRGLAPPKTGA
jgi:uncharacterized protein (DUF433 family)